MFTYLEVARVSKLQQTHVLALTSRPFAGQPTEQGELEIVPSTINGANAGGGKIL